jgi:hypothetical protein
MKSTLIDYDVSNELSNKLIGNMNKLEVVSIPIGVVVYVTDVMTTNLSRAEELTDLLKIKLNDNEYAPSQDLYIHTVGTSATRLYVRQTSVSSPVQESDNGYFENTPKQELALETSVATSIEDNKTANESSLAILNTLDKIVHPYEPNIIEFNTNSTSRITLLSKTLSCDKISLNYIGGMRNDNSTYQQHGNARVYLDGTLISISGGYSGTSGNGHVQIDIENVKDKTLLIDSYNGSTSYSTCGILQEFTKKA